MNHNRSHVDQQQKTATTNNQFINDGNNCTKYYNPCHLLSVNHLTEHIHSTGLLKLRLYKCHIK